MVTNSQCWEMLLSPADVVEMTIAVAVEREPSDSDSCDDTGCRVLRGVRNSGEADGAIVK